MNHYKYFNFRNFVALNISDDLHLIEAMGFWEQARIRELQQAYYDGRPILAGYFFPLSKSEFKRLDDAIRTECFERLLKELLVLMEHDLIVVGKSQFQEKTSYGYYAIKQPDGTIYDAIEVVRQDYLKDPSGDSTFGWSWMIQATTKGWDWAKDRKDHMDLALYHEEQEHFYELKLRS